MGWFAIFLTGCALCRAVGAFTVECLPQGGAIRRAEGACLCECVCCDKWLISHVAELEVEVVVVVVASPQQYGNTEVERAEVRRSRGGFRGSDRALPCLGSSRGRQGRQGVERVRHTRRLVLARTAQGPHAAGSAFCRPWTLLPAPDVVIGSRLLRTIL